MTKYNREKLVLIFSSLIVVPFFIWLMYLAGEPQSVWIVNLIFGLQ
jgi:hypothetical protein